MRLAARVRVSHVTASQLTRLDFEATSPSPRHLLTLRKDVLLLLYTLFTKGYSCFSADTANRFKARL